MSALRVALLLLCACRLVTREVEHAECEINGDCDRSKICYFAACIEPLRAPGGELYVTIRPNERMPYFAQDQGLAVSDGRVELVWATTSTYTGLARANEGENFNTGSITFTRTSVIPGLTRSFETKIRGTGAYTANLEPGAYDVVFTPLLTNRAQIRVGRWVVEDDTARTGQNIEYPSLTTNVGGTLLASETDPSPRSDAIVYGVADGTTLLSSVTTSTAAGRFTLQFAGAPTGATLYIRPGHDAPFLPQIAQHIAIAAGGTQLAPIYISGIGSTATIEGTVVGTLDTQVINVPGAAVFATTTVGGGVYRTGTVTDASGAFSLPVIRASTQTPLDYEITTLPVFTALPATVAAQFGRSTTRFLLQSSGITPPLSIILGTRPLLTGTLLDHNGSPARDVSITARRITATEAGTASTFTGEGGAFSLRLDAGEYELTLIPRNGSQFARLTRRVSIDHTDVALQLALPPPALIAGEIKVAPGGLSLDGSTLSFFRIVDGEVQLIGEARVSSTTSTTSGTLSLDGDVGHFSATLPAISSP